MSIIVKQTDSKVVSGKKNITLKDILVSEITLVDIDGVDLTKDFIDELPEGVTSVTFKASFELDTEHEDELEVGV